MASPAERAEIDDLHALFGHSDVPKGLFLKFEVSRHNRAIADQGRQEKAERDRLLQERREEQNRRIQDLRKVRGERDQEAVARMVAEKTREAERIKEAEAAWEAKIMKDRMELKQRVANRGSADFHNARLAEAEAAMLQERRDRAQAEYDAYKQMQRETYAERMRQRRDNAGKMRQDVENAHTGASTKLSNMKNTLANRAREDKAAWKEQLRKNEEERMARAHANRKHAEEVRAKMRQNMEQQTKNRQTAGTRMARTVDDNVERAKTDLMNYKKGLRQERYKARYATMDESKALEESTFRKLYGLQGA